MRLEIALVYTIVKGFLQSVPAYVEHVRDFDFIWHLTIRSFLRSSTVFIFVHIMHEWQ